VSNELPNVVFGKLPPKSPLPVWVYSHLTNASQRKEPFCQVYEVHVPLELYDEHTCTAGLAVKDQSYKKHEAFVE
jgi:hypothetical protein